MRAGTLLRLALAGTRTDTVRVALTALTVALATLSLLATATVLAIQPAGEPGGTGRPVPGTGDVMTVDGVPSATIGYAHQYTSNLLVEPGLRPGVAFALLLLCIPVLALAGQSAQVGAPARDRRLARCRLAGATPRQAGMVAVAETGLAALVGAGVGFAAYFTGRVLLHRPDDEGRLPLPTDQLPPAWGLVLIAVGLPLLAAGFAALLLRRVAFTPFGLARRQRTRRPRPWPGVLIILGVAAFAVAEPLHRLADRMGTELPAWVTPVLLGGGGFLAMLGVVLGTGWISYATGRMLHRFARRPAPLLAARRLLADPWTGSRVFAALLACVLVGAGAAGLRAWFSATFAAQEQRSRASAEIRGEEYIGGFDDNAFYFRTLDLVDAAVTVAMVIAALGLVVFLAEGLVSRRRSYSALVATGVPRRTLARTVGWQLLTPVVPAIAVALAVGVSLPRGISTEESSGGTVQVCDVDDQQCLEDPSLLRTVEIPEVVRPVRLPFGELALVGGTALAAVVVTVGIALLFLRASTDLAELRAD